MASAQLYWGRMAALLLRIVYAIFPGIDWGFVFVDDFAWLIREPQSAIYSTAILVLLLSLGTPLSWKKTVLNPVNTWLGFVIDPTGPIVQMATDKNSLVLNLLDKLAAGDVFTLKDLEKGMGRLQWATSACPLTKPLLQPLWQWKSVLRSSGRPNHLIRVFARMLRLLFQEPYVQPTPMPHGHHGMGRVTQVPLTRKSITLGVGSPPNLHHPKVRFIGSTLGWKNPTFHGCSSPRQPVP